MKARLAGAPNVTVKLTACVTPGDARHLKENLLSLLDLEPAPFAFRPVKRTFKATEREEFVKQLDSFLDEAAARGVRLLSAPGQGGWDVGMKRDWTCHGLGVSLLPDGRFTRLLRLVVLLRLRDVEDSPLPGRPRPFLHPGRGALACEVRAVPRRVRSLQPLSRGPRGLPEVDGRGLLRHRVLPHGEPRLAPASRQGPRESPRARGGRSRGLAETPGEEGGPAARPHGPERESARSGRPARSSRPASGRMSGVARWTPPARAALVSCGRRLEPARLRPRHRRQRFGAARAADRSSSPRRDARSGASSPRSSSSSTSRGRVVEGRDLPSTETPMHLFCYRRRGDVGGRRPRAPAPATAFAAAAVSLDAAVMPEIVRPSAPSRSSRTPRRGRRSSPARSSRGSSDHDAFLLASHGRPRRSVAT